MDLQSVIETRAAAQFLSGRFGALALLLAYQVLLGGVLSAGEYAAYALTLAWCGLGQTLLGLGVPRVFSRFLSLAGRGMAPRAALRLLVFAALIRLGTGGLVAITGVLGLQASPYAHATPFVLSGAAWGAAGLLQFELDAAAQALGLQRAARQAGVGEAAVRLAATAALALAGRATALPVLWIGAATAGIASAWLFAAAAARLSGAPAGDADRPIVWTDVRRTALGGHAGALAWAISSPPVIRLLARAVLPTEAFAGFSFVQALVVSAQRYMPSFILFPLLEPAVMAEAARGAVGRLKTTLALLVKLDALAIGLSVAASAAGVALVPLIAHGRYREAAAFAPWLLALAAISGAHRAYEVAAIGVGASQALGRALLVSLGWILVAIAGGERFGRERIGLAALLLWPLGEAACRLWTVQRALDGQGLRDLLGLCRLSRIAASAAAPGLAAWLVVSLCKPVFALDLVMGGLAVVGFLILAVMWAPFDRAEADALRSAARRLLRRPGSNGPLQVVVATPRGRGGAGGVDRLMDTLRPRLAVETDVRVRFVTTRGRWRWSSPLVFATAALRLAAWLAAGKIDVLHLNLGTGASLIRKRLLAALCSAGGRPYVLHLHGSGFDAFWDAAPVVQQARIARLFDGAARVLVLGELWRAMVAARVPSAAARLAVLPNASDPIARTKAAKGGVHLLFLGELGPRKGVGVLLDALASLPPAAPWDAVIAGDGAAGPYRVKAVQLGLQERVVFPGLLPAAAARAELAAADILVLPSFEENLPMAVVEAMGAGLAIVATPVGAVGDLIETEQTGLLVAPGDAFRLSGALQRLIEDEALRRRLGAAAAARHQAMLSLDVYIPALIGQWRCAQRACKQILQPNPL